jgi:hypothetical protein
MRKRKRKRRIETWDDLYKNPEDRPAEKGCQPWAEMLDAPNATLSPRDLVITAVSRLDVAITELLRLRLVDDEEAQEGFLGIYEEGGTPAGSFGARISLAYLVGVLPKHTLPELHSMRKLRNLMAHRVNASLLEQRAQNELNVLRKALLGERRPLDIELPERPENDCSEAAVEHPARRLVSTVNGLYDDARASDKDEAAAARVVWFQAVALEFGLRLIRGHQIDRLKEWDETEHEHGAPPPDDPSPAVEAGGS